MKNTIIISTIVSTLIAGIPIHSNMDSRIKGLSFNGDIDDNIAAKDGLGSITLQHHSGSSVINNELKAQKVLKRLLDKETNVINTSNVKQSLIDGSIGSTEEKSIVESVLNQDISNELINTDCKSILASGNSTGDGIYTINLTNTNSFDVYCDMTTDDGGWTLYFDFENGLHQMTENDLNLINYSEVKIGKASSNSVYISDNKLIMATYDSINYSYASTNDSITCNNNYTDFKNNINSITVTNKYLSCYTEDIPFANHTCYSHNGWIFYNTAAHLGTYNYGGNHPCPTSTRIENKIWVR